MNGMRILAGEFTGWALDRFFGRVGRARLTANSETALKSGLQEFFPREVIVVRICAGAISDDRPYRDRSEGSIRGDL